jgi:hypothetical protein
MICGLFLLAWVYKATLRKHMQQLHTDIVCTVSKFGKLNYETHPPVDY